MTTETEELSRERHLVVVFDICSSTTILEDLKRTDNLGAWKHLLIFLKDYLLEKGGPLQMDLYKFIGDGWVLLFPNAAPKKELCDFLSGLSRSFEEQFDACVRPLLSQEPSPVGLMFGIDAGELHRIVLDNQIEYVGRAINVAARLQSYTKELAGGPSYKVIFSKNSFNSPAPPPAGLAVESIKVSLRNISPATIQCFVWQAHEAKSRATTVPVMPIGPSKAMRPDRAPTAPLSARSDVDPAVPMASKGASGVSAGGKLAAASLSAPTAPLAAMTGPKAGAPATSAIKALDARILEMAALVPLGKWTLHRTGQPGILLPLTMEAAKREQAATSTLARAQLIYHVGGKEILRVKAAWLDGFDVARFNANDMRGVILGVGNGNGFCALEVVRAMVNGAERVEVRLARFASIPAKLTVVVQLTSVNARDLLYEGELAITTNPLTAARVS